MLASAKPACGLGRGSRHPKPKSHRFSEMSVLQCPSFAYAPHLPHGPAAWATGTEHHDSLLPFHILSQLGRHQGIQGGEEVACQSRAGLAGVFAK